jgi:hypothetical protein
MCGTDIPNIGQKHTLCTQYPFWHSSPDNNKSIIICNAEFDMNARSGGENNSRVVLWKNGRARPFCMSVVGEVVQNVIPVSHSLPIALAFVILQDENPGRSCFTRKVGGNRLDEICPLWIHYDQLGLCMNETVVQSWKKMPTIIGECLGSNNRMANTVTYAFTKTETAPRRWHAQKATMKSGKLREQIATLSPFRIPYLTSNTRDARVTRSDIWP